MADPEEAVLAELPPDRFPPMLPLVRRAFAGFSPAERRLMGEKIARMAAGAGSRPAAPEEDMPIDLDRARRVLPVLTRLLGR